MHTKLRDFVSSFNIKGLYLAGDFSLRRMLGETQLPSKVEVVCAYPHESMIIGSIFASEFMGEMPVINDELETVKVQIGENTVEFQSYSTKSHMKNPEIRDWLSRRKAANGPLADNIWGRGFTLYGLCESVRSGRLYDITERASEDIEDKSIDTLLPPVLSLRYCPELILEAIKLSCAYNFEIAPKLRKQMKLKTRLLFKSFSQEKLIAEIIAILNLNPEKGLEQLKEYGLDGLLKKVDISKYMGEDEIEDR